MGDPNLTASMAGIDAKIEKLKEKKKKMQLRASERFVRAAIDLIVKAGLRGANKAFLLGVLVEAASHAPGSSEHARLEQLGKTAFGETQE